VGLPIPVTPVTLFPSPAAGVINASGRSAEGKT
jgi:hypothetical protein